MKYAESRALRVIEIPYGDLGWGVAPENREEIVSDIQLWNDMYRELDDYKICGVYGKAEIPYDIEVLEYEVVEGLEVYESMTKTVSDMVKSGLDEERSVIVTGGYCKDAVGIAGGIRRSYGEDKKIGIVWLDAHSDMNRPATTSTGMLGGMPLSTIVGVDLEHWRKLAGINIPFDSSNVILSDYRVKDAGADSNIAGTNINIVDSSRIGDFAGWRERIAAFSEKVDVIYLHVDIDVLDGKYAPDHVTLADQGPDIATISEIIRMVMATGKVAVFFMADVFFDTDAPGKEISTLSAMRLIGAGLEAWKKRPYANDK